MLRSIRWQLQIWYAAMLVLTVMGTSLGSYFAIQQARYREIDSELEAAAQVLAGKLRGPPLMPGDHHHPPFDDGFGNEGPAAPVGLDDPNGPVGLNGREGRGGPVVPGGGPGGPGAFNPDDGIGGPLRPQDDFGIGGIRPDRLPRVINLPLNFLQRYGGSEIDARSFVIYRDDRHIVKQWGAIFDPLNLPSPQLKPVGDAVSFHTRGVMHEVMMRGPENTTVLATGSVQRVDNELHSLIWHLATAGGGVLLIGLAGGWLISRLTLRPIRRMSDTAGSISATQLSRRIDTRVLPTELFQLGEVLNAAFTRLEAAFAQQARFTADASHELRTPLAVILSHSELALSRDRSPDEYRNTIDRILAASTRMKSLVESLLLLSHADQGELSLQPVPMDLSDVVRENVNLLTMLAAQRSITLAADLQNATLIGDPLRIGQVVANLLSNAIRYNREGGSIAVSTEIILGDAVLSVADTGAGISTEDQQHVFDRFFRADKARSRDAGGSGLGLAICKSIVEAHGGQIEVQSVLGEGTTFLVRLPRGDVEGNTPALPERIAVDAV